MKTTRRAMLKTAAGAGVWLAGNALEARGAAETVGTATDLERIGGYLRDNQPVKWIFAGDSITHGARHLNGWRDYPQLFEERVRWELRQERNLVIRTATSGWTIERIAGDLDWRVLQFQPQVVSLHFGMNDCAAGEGGLAAFGERYQEVIARIRAESGAAVIVHTPNPIIPRMDERREPHLAAYAEAARAAAAATGAVLVDHFAHWQEYMKTSQLFYLMNDAIHPNEFGHRYKAHLLFQVLGIWDPQSAVCRLPVPT